MKNRADIKLPVFLLNSFIILVPVSRCLLFFDSYLIKYWIVQAGIAVISVFYIYSLGDTQTAGDKSVRYLLAFYGIINFVSWAVLPYPYRNAAFPAVTGLIIYLFLCVFTYTYITRPDNSIKIWIVTSVYIALMAIYQKYHVHNIEGHEVIATLGNENFLASYIAMTVPIVMGFSARYLEKEGTVPSFSQKSRDCPFFFRGSFLLFKQSFILGIFTAVILILFTALYFTHSRGGWVGIISGLTCFFILIFVKKGYRRITILFIILFTLIILCTPFSINFIAKQFKGDVRIPIWEATAHMIALNPILGWGKGAYFIYYPQFRVMEYWLSKDPTDLTIHAHNEFLQIWAETGTIGLLVFIALFAVIFGIGVKKINNWTNRGDKYLMIGLLSSIVCLLAHNMLCNNLQMHSGAIFLWLTAGLVIGFREQEGRIISQGDAYTKKGRVIWRILLLLALIIIMSIILWSICIKSVIANYIYKQGWIYRSVGCWDIAIEKYENALEYDPWNIEMRYRLAYAYAMNNNPEMALKEYEEVIKTAPDYGYVHKNMGIIYLETGDYKKAAQCLIKAWQINPYNEQTLYNLEALKKKAKR